MPLASDSRAARRSRIGTRGRESGRQRQRLGIGIAAEEIDRIFNEFTQASYETAVRFGGTGLGLTITRRLLELYGSAVQVHSTPGEGSTFSFNLRLPVPPNAPVL
jgi:signal transduction histidine kinase